MPSQPAQVTHTRCLSAVFEPEVPAEEEEAGGGGPPEQGVRETRRRRKRGGQSG